LNDWQWLCAKCHTIFDGRIGEGAPFYGRNHSQQSIAKISQAKKGHVSENKGKTWSEETKKKISEAVKKYYKKKRRFIKV
jgi:GH18 family chitinase